MTPRVQQEWYSRVKAEYGSAAIAARMLQYLIAVGGSDTLINTCMRIVRDELDHARLSHECLVAFGGNHLSVSIHADDLSKVPTQNNILPQMLDELTQSFLLGESFAVPLFHGMYANAKHPLAKAMLTRVLQDEGTHRAFGWAVLDAMLQRPGTEIRMYISTRLPDLLTKFKAAYAPENSQDTLSQAELDFGLMQPSDYYRIWKTCYGEDLMHRFQARQIECPPFHSL